VDCPLRRTMVQEGEAMERVLRTKFGGFVRLS
jgi:hypothetical protein